MFSTPVRAPSESRICMDMGVGVSIIIHQKIKVSVILAHLSFSLDCAIRI